MPPLNVFFSCLAQALCAKGLKALAGMVPFGEAAYDVAAETLRLLRERRQDARAALQGAAGAGQADAAKVAEQAAREQAAGESPEVRQAVASYLAQVPAVLRQSLRRPEDPTGTTLPATLALSRPEELAALLPTRLPRFRAGDRPPGMPDWVLEEMLGVGGFGEVWRASNPHTGETAALKFCLDAEAAKSLKNEAALLRRVQAENAQGGVVKLLDTALAAEPPFLKYEYVPGGDLAGLVRSMQDVRGRGRAEQALGVVTRLATIVARFHRLGPPIVHRDLKPANVLVLPEGRSFDLRVADFGIGGLAAAQVTRADSAGTLSRGQALATALRGTYTPLYASPQQRKGGPPDPRDDVYALGVIWYQLLTGEVDEGVPASWREEVAGTGLTEAEAQLLGACLHARTEKRLADAAELAARLRALRAPADRARPAGTWVGWTLAGVAACVLLAVAVGLLMRGGGSEDRHAGAQPAPKGGPKPPADIGALPKTLTNSLGMKLALIPAGTFTMGSPASEKDRYGDEGPQHEVEITKPFYLGAYEVTQTQYHQVMGTNPSWFSPKGGGKAWVGATNTDDFPVETVSWGDAVEFCKKLSALPEEKRLGRVYRLPTEAEWEYSCRGGASSYSPFHFGDSLSSAQANFDGSRPYGGAGKGPNLERTTTVGSHKPNAFGLYDMHGNVFEWCADWYDKGYYKNSPPRNPKGPEKGTDRVLRGGSWFNSGGCRSAVRSGSDPGARGNTYGFRVVLVPPGLP